MACMSVSWIGLRRMRCLCYFAAELGLLPATSEHTLPVEILKVSQEDPDPNLVDYAAAFIRRGRVVGSAYGYVLWIGGRSV